MIETMSSIVIILGSLQGLPLSTTHCQVGAVVGVGCTETKYLGGKFEPYPEFSMPTDQLGELAGILVPETGELMEEFTFQSGEKIVTAHKGWKILSVNGNAFASNWVEEYQVRKI